jgi:hypothetical protein
MDLVDLRNAIGFGRSVVDICRRSEDEVRQKVAELKLSQATDRK